MTHASRPAILLPALLLLHAACAFAGPSPAATEAATQTAAVPVHYAVPGRLDTGDGLLPLRYENGFMLVPENRSDPASRIIAVRYLRFLSQSRTPAAPVVMLPGGPGTLMDESALKRWPETLRTIRHAIRSRDYVILQQRGVRDGLYAAGLDMRLAAMPSDAATEAGERQRLRDALQDALRDWEGLGVDLRGYTVLEMVADLDALRGILGHAKFILYGTSFGSQWGLSYLKLHQDHVERALLTGLEPLDYTYDSPQGIWQTLQRIGQRAAAEPGLAAALGEGGLGTLYRRVLARLQEAPQRVRISPPGEGEIEIEIEVGPEDLRRVLYPIAGDLRASAEAWPRFLAEMDRGDYRYLAALAWQQRQPRGVSLLGSLVDNSLGITPARDARLRAEPAAQWLGDINSEYTWTRDMVPTADVGDDFRSDFELRIPTLLIQGDCDLSTPLENALTQRPYLRQGHLLLVEGGTHDVRREILTPALTLENPQVGDAMLRFIAAEDNEPATTALQRFPDRVRLAPMHFQGLDGASLYEQWYERQHRTGSQSKNPQARTQASRQRNTRS